MSILGLTGNIASGKSTVLKLLKNKGAVIFDADKRIHYYYRKKKSFVYKRIAKAFPQVLRKGVISRSKLADIVFSDKNKLNILEAIVHPVVLKDLYVWIKAKKNKQRIYVAEVPLLFEKRLKFCFDKIIVVVAKKEVAIKRIMGKYGISKKEALRRLALNMEIKKKMKMADFVVNNNSDFKKLKEEVDLLWKNLKQK